MKHGCPARFAPKRGSSCDRAPPAPFCAPRRKTEFERLKKPFARAAIGRGADAGTEPSVAARGQRRGGTGMGDTLPLLVFPVLFEEITQAALRQAERQARIFREQPRTARRMNRAGLKWGHRPAASKRFVREDGRVRGAVGTAKNLTLAPTASRHAFLFPGNHRL